VIDSGEEVLINCTLVWGYKWGAVVYFVLTLEVVMSGEVHSRCSRMLDYERVG